MSDEQQGGGHGKTFKIIVNGTPELWSGNVITYEQVVQLAFPGAPSEMLFTVSYSSEHGKSGTLAPGGKTDVKEGMVFDVVKTNRS